jgi:SAM-dependent methyltransferase
MDVSRTHRLTAEAWDETAAIYEREEQRDVELLRAGGSGLLAIERELLGDLARWCGTAIHLQCAAGKDTLSLLNQGAARVVGLDISARMIESARRRSAALAAPARWICSDVVAAPAELDGTADLVYTGKGALPWMMDIQAWADVVFRLLRPGGRLFVFEGHPLDWVWDTEGPDFRFRGQAGYFSDEVEVGQRWPAPYLARLAGPEAGKPKAHERQWTFGPILNSLVQTGLRLRHFQEHAQLFWNQFPNVAEPLAQRLPHTFSLIMQKEPSPGC